MLYNFLQLEICLSALRLPRRRWTLPPVNLIFEVHCQGSVIHISGAVIHIPGILVFHRTQLEKYSCSSFSVQFSSVQFSSVAQSCLTLCHPMNRSTPGFPVHHQLPEFTQTPSIELVMPSSHLILCPSPFPPAPNPSQYQSLFQ